MIKPFWQPAMKENLLPCPTLKKQHTVAWKRCWWITCRLSGEKQMSSVEHYACTCHREPYTDMVIWILHSSFTNDMLQKGPLTDKLGPLRVWAHIHLFILLAFLRINARDEPRAGSTMSLREVIIIKEDIAANFSLFIKSSSDSPAYEASLQSCDICHLLRDTHYSSGSTADKVTDPDKTKPAQAETSFVLSLSWWHKWLFNVDLGKKKRIKML